MKDIYVTLVFDEYDLRKLSADQMAIVKKLFKKHKNKPSHAEFTNYYMRLCKPVFDALPRKRIPDSPLYNIAQDLGMRLGIEQGEIRAPDYRDMLEYIIRREYNSIADFCRETGEDPTYLSHLFSKNKNASVDRLRRILDKLGYQLRFSKKHELSNV